ncbi:hypothetical protein [Paracoccus sp. SM22M-07]|uniref:hypothetical protein n=1 Tax=Paracoccus sp. SM22M-07 TaxID=1520813 RepID=UPI00091D37A5|nr:hypothetical protein [Paracoccus sp. SM22M-07]OJH45178.1 hypothetical protein IE00_05825 [Paracoccus sp. SM22M-07]
MAAYTVADATRTAQQLPARGAGVWVQPLGGSIRIASTQAELALVGTIASGVPYELPAAGTFWYRAEGGAKVKVRMWDKPA